MVYILQDENFNLLISNSGKKLLCTGIPDISLILFHTPDCEYCGELKETFKTMGQLVQGVSFAMCNLRQCPKTLQLSKESTTVFQFVPYVLCYINGKPYAKYEGDRSIKGLKDFIQLVFTNVESFKTSPQLQKDELNDQVSNDTYTPINKAKRCYLTMDEAYGGAANGKREKVGGAQTFEQAYGCQSMNGSGMDGSR